MNKHVKTNADIVMLVQKNSEPFKVGLILTLGPVFSALLPGFWWREIYMDKKVFGGSLIFSGMVIGSSLILI